MEWLSPRHGRSFVGWSEAGCVWHADVMPRQPMPCVLLAGAGLLDPNFVKTVVLLLEWNDEGAFGLVLNRPTDIEVGEHLPEWAPRTTTPAVVHVGGPVQQDVAIGLNVTRGVVPTLVDLAETPDDSQDLSVRVFAGYAGWGPLQPHFRGAGEGI